tara:strand:+ start:174 stop:500 length:327 start_codon:yes stop_codon:yes gene_type:complete
MGLEQQLQQPAITGVQTAAIHPMQREGFIDQSAVDRSGAVTDTGHISHPTQQSVGNARRAPAAECNLSASIGREIEVEQTGGPLDNRLQVVQAVELKTLNQAKAIAQR